MKLKEQLKEKKDALKALEDRIKAEDAEAIKEAAELSDAIDALEKSIADAKKAAEKLAKIGTDEDPDAKGEEPEGLKNARGTVSTYIKAYNDAEAMGDNKIITYDQNVVSVMPKLGMLREPSTEHLRARQRIASTFRTLRRLRLLRRSLPI